jgi:hypothetical protein
MNIQFKLAIISLVLYLVARANARAISPKTKPDVAMFWIATWLLSAALTCVFAIWYVCKL